MADLFDDVPARVLAVYAHPDDADVASAGTLARWARAGSEVHLVVCTDGARGTSDPDTDTDTLALERATRWRRRARWSASPPPRIWVSGTVIWRTTCVFVRYWSSGSVATDPIS